MGAKKTAAKPRGKAAPKKSAKKPAKAKAAPKAKAKAKAKTPKLKAPTKAVPKKKRASTAKPVADVELIGGEEGGEDDGGEKKPGALARLKSGVGSLFARMTGRGKKPDEEPAVLGEATTMPPDVTIDIVTKDIILSEDAPPPTPKRRSKRVTQPDD